MSLKRAAVSNAPSAPREKKGRKEAAKEGVSQQCASKLVNSISRAQFNNVKANLKIIGEIPMGSACSGSNSGTMMSAQVLKRLGVGSLKLIFDCEQSKKKALFGQYVNKYYIEDRGWSGPCCCFTDVNQLGNYEAECHFCPPSEGKEGCQVCPSPGLFWVQVRKQSRIKNLKQFQPNPNDFECAP
jgi:hypothetical protein